MTRIRLRAPLLASLALLLLPAPAHAVPTTAVMGAPGPCDPLAVPFAVDELGNPPTFPADERIASLAGASLVIACAPTKSTGPDPLVTITNLTTRSFSDLWYVADPETSITNVDGFINGEEAFRIDAAGINVSLVFESILADGIFSPGESWDFIIQDYLNGPGLPASAFASIGAPSAADLVSSGSILAIEVEAPEPGSLALLAIGLLALRGTRRW